LRERVVIPVTDIWKMASPVKYYPILENMANR
jgi:hypothetical protein